MQVTAVDRKQSQHENSLKKALGAHSKTPLKGSKVGNPVITPHVKQELLFDLCVCTNRVVMCHYRTCNLHKVAISAFLH